MNRVVPAAALAAFLSGCAAHHSAALRESTAFPEEAPVEHTSRLWLDLDDGTGGTQCVVARGHLPLCFEEVDRGVTSAFRRVLWPSFREVRVRERDDELEPDDYVLRLEVHLDALHPEPRQVGWAAGARGRWQLVQGGFPIAGESFSSRSRGGFPYSRKLAVGAAEIIDALAVRVAGVLNGVLEPEPEPREPPPAFVAVGFYGPIREPHSTLAARR